MAPAETALCFVLLGSNSPEKQPTPSLPAPADITELWAGSVSRPPHRALLLGLPQPWLACSVAATPSRPRTGRV